MEDTLTSGRTTHRANVMFVQPVKLVMSVESQEALIIPTKKQNTEMAAFQTSVEAYHTHRRGNPFPHPEYNTTLHDDTRLQRNRCFGHAIVRKMASNTDASDQMIGAYSGFQASLEDNQDKNQAYYYFTHAQPPNKTVVNEMIQRTAEAVEYKSMPSISRRPTCICSNIRTETRKS